MSTQFEDVVYSFMSFIPYENEVLRNEFKQLTEKVKELNKDNVIVFIPVGSIVEHHVDISDYEYDDYEILTGTYIDKDGNEFYNEREYYNYLKERAKEKFEIRKGYLVEDGPYLTLDEIENTLELDEKIEEIYLIYDKENDEIIFTVKQIILLNLI